MTERARLDPPLLERTEISNGLVNEYASVQHEGDNDRAILNYLVNL
jgi:hypothetical protein